MRVAVAAAVVALGAPGASVSEAAERFVHVGNVGPQDGKGAVTGDVGAQTRRTLEALDVRLKAGGSSLAQAAAVMVYLRNASDFGAMNAAYATFWPKDPPTRTTIVTRPSHPDALVEMSATGLRAGVERTVVLPGGWKASPSPYSYGIRSGDTLFLSGLVARNPQDNTVAGSGIAPQTRQVLDNGAAILGAAGMSHADVASARVYITDAATFQDMNATYRTAFPKAPPARATVVSALAGSDYVVEITMLAVKGARETFAVPNPDGTPGSPNPNLSGAVRVGDRLHVAGLLGNTPANPGDAAAQTAEILARLGRVLKTAGFTPAEVTDGVVYVTDWKHRPAVEAELAKAFGANAPPLAWVESALVARDAPVEIMVNATKR